MAETLEELTARHERELEELEEKKSARLEAARALGKGKKAKEALDAAERDVGNWEYELSERQREELEELESVAGAAGKAEPAEAAAAADDGSAKAVKEQAKVAEVDAEAEAARIREKKEKAAKKREKKALKTGGYSEELKEDTKPEQPAAVTGASMMSPSMRPCRSPSQRWQEDPVAVEDLVPATHPPKPAFEIIEGIQPFSDGVQSNTRMKEILDEVKALSMDAFEEDALTMVTKKARWKMTLLVRSEDGVPQFSLDGADLGDEDQEDPPLIGFVVYKIRTEFESFSIAKIAVVPEHRNQGHGGRLMDWVKSQAKKQKDIKYISLSSLPDAVRFYKKIGFQPVDVNINPADDEVFVEGQVYMEYQVRKRSHKKK